MKDVEETLQDAREEQLGLASLVSMTDDPLVNSKYIIGVDVSYNDTEAFVCAAIFNSETKQIVQRVRKNSRCDFPYISGFFYLREAPLIIDIINEIEYQGPILIDGNGILHPRRMGLASYVGVKLNKPTIGVAKRLLLGDMNERRKDEAMVVDGDVELGAALWLGKRKHPVYISIGHRVSLATAICIVQTSSVYGIPEPLRQAHLCSKLMRTQKA